MSDYEIIMIIFTVLSLMIAFGGLIIGMISFFQKGNHQEEAGE